MDTALRDFLEIPYDKLEELNLQAKADRVAGKDPGKTRDAHMKYLTDERRIKAVIEGLQLVEQRLAPLCILEVQVVQLHRQVPAGHGQFPVLTQQALLSQRTTQLQLPVSAHAAAVGVDWPVPR